MATRRPLGVSYKQEAIDDNDHRTQVGSFPQLRTQRYCQAGEKGRFVVEGLFPFVSVTVRFHNYFPPGCVPQCLEMKTNLTKLLNTPAAVRWGDLT